MRTRAENVGPLVLEGTRRTEAHQIRAHFLDISERGVYF